jgi:hypothetical protein
MRIIRGVSLWRNPTGQAPRIAEAFDDGSIVPTRYIRLFESGRKRDTRHHLNEMEALLTNEYPTPSGLPALAGLVW